MIGSMLAQALSVVNMDDVWQIAANILASLGGPLALFLGMGAFFMFFGWLRGFLATLGKKEDSWF